MKKKTVVFDFAPLEGIKAYWHRTREGMTQKDYWDQFGVSQSAGSRYESGRKIPLQVSALMYIKYPSLRRAINPIR